MVASLVIATTPLVTATSQVNAATITNNKQTEMYSFVRDTFKKHNVRGIVT